MTLVFGSCGLFHRSKNSENAGSSTSDSIPINNLVYQKDTFFNRVYFSKSDAEIILGEKAHISDSSSTIKKDTFEIKKAYTADIKNHKTDKTGVIYFMLEKYSYVSSAKNAYTFFKVANEKHEGIKVINDIGDDAYFHSDGNNFYFILVRKGNKLLRLKVNKITSHTSLSGFYLISKKISDFL
jgi:hypothetical protein